MLELNDNLLEASDLCSLSKKIEHLLFKLAEERKFGQKRCFFEKYVLIMYLKYGFNVFFFHSQ